MNIKIESGVPMPERVRSNGVTAALRALKVGQSVLLTPSLAFGVFAVANRLKIKIATRTTETGQKRVWRVE